MSDSGVYLPSASSTESCDTLYSSNSSALRRRTACIKRKFRRRLIKTIQFSPAVFRSRLEQKFSVTEYLLCCVCVLFSMAKFMLRISSIWWHFIPSHYVRRRFSSVSALEFRCCREIPLVNQKLTFYERISCIRRHDGFSPRSYRAVSLQVAPFVRDCKDRGYTPAKCQRKRMLNNRVRCGKRPLNYSPDLASRMCSWQASSKLVRSMRPTTLKSKISSMSTIEMRPFWSYSYIL